MQTINTFYYGLVFTSALLLYGCGSGSSNKPDTTETTEFPESAIDNVAPRLTQLSPDNNASVHSRLVTVRGRVSDDNALTSVVISYNDERIIASLEGDRFSAVIEATAGANTYSVIATDEANNEAIASETFYFGARASAGGAHSGVIKNANIYTWGRNNKGQSGLGFISSINDDAANAEGAHPIMPTLVPVPTANGESVKMVSLAFNQNASSALDTQGNVWSWGNGSDGQLGLGAAGDNVIDEAGHTTPQKIHAISDVIAISRGSAHCLLLKTDGTVFAFGRNQEGQLGNGSHNTHDSPVKVSGLTNIVQVSASASSYAIDGDGNLWAWGSNRYGQLGNGLIDDNAHPIPTQILINEPVVSVASGKGHALALTASGAVYGWGLNASHQVGPHTWGENILMPQLLPWFDDVTAIWAKGNQSFIQREDGNIYPWGQNMLGTLGIEKDGDIAQPDSPITGLDNVIDLGNGALHTLAMRSDGEFFTWGWSFEGSLGGGESTANLWSYRVPLLVSFSESP